MGGCGTWGHGCNCRRSEGGTLPVSDTVKALPVHDVEDHGETHGTAEVGGRNGLVALLTSRVPYLKLDRLALANNSLNLNKKC